MIGLSGVASFRLPSAKLSELAGSLESSLKNEAIASVSYCHANCAVTVFDEDLSGCVAEGDEILAIVAGDIYEEDFCRDKAISKAEYVRQVFLHGDAAACAKLNGSYAFLICDTRKSTIFFGTDENSFIPVYYAEHSGVVYFSWDISTVLNAMPNRPAVNYQNLFTWLLVGGRGFEDETRFESIKRLEPGSFVTIKDEGLTVYRSEPFHYRPDTTSEETLLNDAAESLRVAVRRRMTNLDRVALGLSGGLDSRIVLSAGVKEFDGQWACYTYGGANSVERDIARDVALYFGIPHIPIKFEDLMYIDYAKDGVFYSGGASLFKHGMQLHLFATLKSKYRMQGLLLGSALDLVLGGTYSPNTIYKLTDRGKLAQHYRETLFNLTRAEFSDLFREPHQADDFFDGTEETLKTCLKSIPGDHPADINVAFTFDVRVKRWYNHNLIYPLYSHRLLTPTYDHDFLRVVARVPSEMRRDSRFRIKLLTLLDQGVSEIPYNATMQPAWLLPPYWQRFQRIQEEIDKAQQEVWFDSGRKVYLPSNSYDANFLEWFRVYPEYHEFLHRVLVAKDSVLCELFFNRDKVQGLIDHHIEGKAAYHKILVMLVSAELLFRVFVRGESGINHRFLDFSRYIQV